MPKPDRPQKSSPALKNRKNNDDLILLYNLCKDLENNSDQFQKEFKRLLKDKNFLHSGGTLAFGLEYKYNYSQVDCELKGIVGLRGFLKPVDKMLYTFCESCGLSPELKILYGIRNHPEVAILSSTISPFPLQLYGSIPEWKNTNGLDSLREAIDGEDVEMSPVFQVHAAGIKFAWPKPIKHINNRAEYLEKTGDNKYSVSSISRSYVLVVNISKWDANR